MSHHTFVSVSFNENGVNTAVEKDTFPAKLINCYTKKCKNKCTYLLQEARDPRRKHYGRCCLLPSLYPSVPVGRQITNWLVIDGKRAAQATQNGVEVFLLLLRFLPHSLVFFLVTSFFFFFHPQGNLYYLFSSLPLFSLFCTKVTNFARAFSSFRFLCGESGPLTNTGLTRYDLTFSTKHSVICNYLPNFWQHSAILFSLIILLFWRCHTISSVSV